ncbi:probable flavin-containing monooxygenase 1 [Mangifera indica]|uniref:probable flavin-containing monooxygenase 1 n=1 Tax=Mangifera indica TaxID=29780 RepID=UPI001CFBB2E4|nr:probable flavin-containing monooxygenase 1 [Mangifera indica]
MMKKVAIIGAGVSGLLACKHTLEKGFNPIVFEARSCAGGIWSQTLESTKLQSPKSFYQFSDFPWPPSVTETFPDHNQVMDYLQAYATRFNLFSRIKFNTRVISIDHLITPSGNLENVLSSNFWGGSGRSFSPFGKWNVTVQDAQNPSSPTEAYQVDFVILCIGRYSDLPNLPEFPINKGPEVFDGKVLHSMDYAAMDDDKAAEFIKDKRVAVIGFQKSALDVAAEVSTRNGTRHPCTLLFRTVYWTVPDHFVPFTFRNLNRFTEFMHHRPGEGFFLWILATLLSPMLWIFSKVVELYLKWIYPLKKYKMIPGHGFLQQISSCMFTSLPSNFYDRVEEGSLILRKYERLNFCKNGLLVDREMSPLATDVVILATGFRSDEKLKNIFKSTYFQKHIAGSAPFYRDCIHPRIPQLAILGYSESPAFIYTTEMRSKWLAHFLAGKFELPSITEMGHDVLQWEKCMRRNAGEGYKRHCVSTMLQIHCNDQLCKDMGKNPWRKNSFFAELFAPYGPSDYKNLSQECS